MVVDGGRTGSPNGTDADRDTIDATREHYSVLPLVGSSKGKWKANQAKGPIRLPP